MTVCWVALVAAAFVLGIALTTAALAHRRHHSHFAPLPELPARSVSRWPPAAVRAIESAGFAAPATPSGGTEPPSLVIEVQQAAPTRPPIFRDAEAEGWWHG